jgi:hypothetical protein
MIAMRLSRLSKALRARRLASETKKLVLLR